MKRALPPPADIRLVEGNVRLRPPRIDEAELYARWWADEEVLFGFAAERRSAEEIRAAFPEMENEARDIGHWIEFVMELDGAPVGSAWLSRWDLDARTAELNILIGEPSLRGRGLARRALRLLAAWAFPTMDLRRLYLCPREDHIPARRCYTGMGAHTGEVREHVVTWRGETVCFREMYFDREQFFEGRSAQA